MPEQRPPAVEGDGLYRRLVWTTLLRIAVVSVLLATSSVVLFRAEERQLGLVEQALFTVVIVSYAASLVYLLVLRTAKRWHQRLAYAQVVGDVLIVSCLVWLTGGAESILIFLFPLSVVIAAVLLYRRGAIVSALLCTLALALVAGGLNAGWLAAPSAAVGQQKMPVQRLAFFLFAHASAVFLSAALASYLAEQLKATRERLTLKEHDYLALERLNESIVRSVSSGIVTADRFGRVTYLNRAAEEILGVGLAAARGEPIEGRLPSLKGRLREMPPERFESEHLTADGRKLRLGWAVAPLYDREGTNQGHVIALEDMTGMRAMEETLKRSEKLAAVGALAAGLAHELRNPLASMSGSIQLLQDGQTFADDERRLMSIVLREADRLNGLVRDFLQFARPAPNQLEPLDLREVVAHTLTLFRNDPTRRLLQVQEDLPAPLPVVADKGQLGQVLWNLLTNAAEALPQGGKVRLSGRVEAGAVLLQVEDDGPGISADDLPHIFEPFYTTKARGTGLGLAIVHSILQGHGGEIAVESAEGRGTRFCLKLPLRPAAARSA
jgi:two-component system, NtrC family, sensor histidine kinase PilS